MAQRQALIKIAMLDFWTLVPYYTSCLYDALRNQGVDITLASVTYDLDPECFRRAGIHNIPGCLDLAGRKRIHSPAVRRCLKILEGTLNIIAWAVRILFHRPQLIHFQQIRLFQEGIPVEWWFLKYAKFLQIGTLYTVHNILPHDTAEKHRRAFLRLYREIDALICHSGDIKAKLIKEFGIAQEKIWVIPHGPLFQQETISRPKNYSQNAKTTTSECWVVCQGMIRPYKGIPFLLDAWKQVEAMDNRARLVIAGMGEASYLEQLKQQARQLNLCRVEFDFRFLPVEELSALLQRAHVLVYPYKEITTSGALMTGLAQGKAVVATDLAPFREILSSGKNALLVDHGDTQHLAQSLLWLVENGEERARLARALQKTAAQTRQWADIARETRVCYEAVLANSVGDSSMAGMPCAGQTTDKEN